MSAQDAAGSHTDAAGGGFSPRIAAVLIAAGAISFLAALFFMGTEQTVSQRTAVGPTSYSDSAIGHSAVVDLIDRLGYPVTVSTYGSAEKAGADSILVLAEPLGRYGWFDRENLDALLEAPTVLLVLPKRTGVRDPNRLRWIDGSDLRQRADVAEVLEHAVPGARVTLGKASAWSVNRLGIDPALDPERKNPSWQLMRGAAIEPIVASGRQVLFGRIPTSTGDLFVLSEPDLIANHGIGDGDNAAFLAALLDFIRPAGATVIVDETVHGFKQAPSLVRAALSPPFLAATILALAAAGALGWAALGRFGPALPLPPPLRPGKAGLIDNTAGLLVYGGHTPALVARYLEAARRDVLARFHAPRGLDPGGTTAWLDQVAETRGLSARLAPLEARMRALTGAATPDAAALLDLADDIHSWKQGMTDAA